MPVCTTTCRAVTLFLNPYENRPSQSKESFSFFTSLHFFFVFSHYLQSHSLSLVAYPCFFAPQTVPSIVVFFYTICCHLSSSVSNSTQSLQSFPKVSKKILIILLQCEDHMVTSGTACPSLRGRGKTASSPYPLILHELLAVIL